MLTLFATAAGAAGAATLSTAPSTSQRTSRRARSSAPPIALDDIEDTKLLARKHTEQRAGRSTRQRASRGRTSQAARHSARPCAMWDELADCETGGDWHDGGDYGGGLGIYVGTWRMYGGREFAARPQWASKAQQIAVAERIANDGYGGWGCAHQLGWVN